MLIKVGENEKIILKKEKIMEKKEIKKSAEQMAQERTGDNLMSFIIAKTFSRHAKMTEEEFLKDIGFENSGKTEDEAVRIAFLNVLVETTKQLLQAKQSFKSAVALLKTYLIDESIAEDGKKGE